MNSPKLPVPKNVNNANQRGDFPGQFTDAVDNAEEIRAIEKDPTLFPNSTRIYAVSYTHLTLPTTPYV